LVEYYINFKYNLELVVHMLEEILKGGRKAVATGLALAMLSLPTCWRDQSTQPTPDPEGTITSSLSHTSSGIDQITLDFTNGTVNAYYSLPANCGKAVAYIKSTTNLTVGCPDYWIADVGHVDGLGDVKSIPSAGHTVTSSCVIGNGYVVALQNNTYARVYANKWMESISGGILGVQIKWQYPFDP
jgi:hypothetical protein